MPEHFWPGSKSAAKTPRLGSSDNDGGMYNAGASRIGSMVAEEVQNQESNDRYLPAQCVFIKSVWPSCSVSNNLYITWVLFVAEFRQLFVLQSEVIGLTIDFCSAYSPSWL